MEETHFTYLKCEIIVRRRKNRIKKLTAKMLLALAVLGFAGGTAFTPVAQTAAAETAASRVWVGYVNTVHTIIYGSNGKLVSDEWSNPQEVRCPTSYYLVTKDYKEGPTTSGGYFYRTVYTVVPY